MHLYFEPMLIKLDMITRGTCPKTPVMNNFDSKYLFQADHIMLQVMLNIICDFELFNDFGISA
jgi:hypothetical protein